DFGCGEGGEVLEMARECPGASVIGLDILEAYLETGRRRAAAAGLANRCSFLSGNLPSGSADLLYSIDAFEHFRDPAGVLSEMHRLLRPGGRAFISFGPPWFPPRGSHFPGIWLNLIFTERALMEWRAQFKTDGATKFEQVEGGLNQMTVRRFE